EAPEAGHHREDDEEPPVGYGLRGLPAEHPWEDGGGVLRRARPAGTYGLGPARLGRGRARARSTRLHHRYAAAQSRGGGRSLGESDEEAEFAGEAAVSGQTRG